MNTPEPNDDLIDLIRSNWVPDEGDPHAFQHKLTRTRSRARSRNAATAIVVVAGLFGAVTLSGLWGTKQDTVEPSHHTQLSRSELPQEEPDPYWDSELSESTERDAWPEPYQDLAALVLPDL